MKEKSGVKGGGMHIVVTGWYQCKSTPAEFPMVSWFVIGESVGNAALKRVVDCRIDRELLAVMRWGKWGKRGIR